MVIQRYTREAGVRNLERKLSALARAAAVKVAEQDVQPVAPSLLDHTRIADGGAEVEMDDVAVSVNNAEITNALRTAATLIVDEELLEKVLGVILKISFCAFPS